MMLTGKTAIVTGASRGIGAGIKRVLEGAGATVTDYSRATKHDLYHRAWEMADCDILVNCAGQQVKHDAVSYGIKQFRYDLELMTIAPFDLSQRVASYMMGRQWGRIINIASISSFQGARNLVGYVTAKHALLGLTRALSTEWAQYGITVNAIAPGFIDTDMLKQITVDEKRIPAGHIGKPEDVAAAVLFLCSDAAQYITGACIPVEGGWLAR